MSLASNYENIVLDAILGDGAAAGMPSTVYVALFSVAPDDDTFGTELSGGGYARVAVANNSTNWPDATDGEKSNGVPIGFPEASADWDTAVHWALMDDAAASDPSNIIVHAPLFDEKTILTGQTASFAAETLVIGAD